MFSEAISSISCALAAEFEFDGLGEFRIGSAERGGEETGLAHWNGPLCLTALNENKNRLPVLIGEAGP